MLISRDASPAHAVRAHGPGWVQIGAQRHSASLLLQSDGTLRPWGAPSFEGLRAEHFSELLDLPVDVVLFGSGARLRFVPAAWTAPLLQQRIGVEIMNLPAACRTYNVLAAEGRKVALALLIDAP